MNTIIVFARNSGVARMFPRELVMKRSAEGGKVKSALSGPTDMDYLLCVSVSLCVSVFWR